MNDGRDDKFEYFNVEVKKTLVPRLNIISYTVCRYIQEQGLTLNDHFSIHELKLSLFHSNLCGALAASPQSTMDSVSKLKMHL